MIFMDWNTKAASTAIIYYTAHGGDNAHQEMTFELVIFGRKPMKLLQ